MCSYILEKYFIVESNSILELERKINYRIEQLYKDYSKDEYNIFMHGSIVAHKADNMSRSRFLQSILIKKKCTHIQ